MTGFVVVYDACVLYPAPLRDLLLRLAQAGVSRCGACSTSHASSVRVAYGSTIVSVAKSTAVASRLPPTFDSTFTRSTKSAVGVHDDA